VVDWNAIKRRVPARSKQALIQSMRARAPGVIRVIRVTRVIGVIRVTKVIGLLGLLG
jgi:hypothetical protein